MNPSRIHSVQGRRELRQLQRDRHRGKLLLFFGIAVALAALSYEMGRAYLRMQRVNNFIAALDVNSPAAITAELDRFAIGLTDRNPLVRSASVTAFKVATAWNVEGGAGEWLAAWRTHRHNWRYRPGVTNEPLPEVVSPQPYRSAFPQP